MARLLSSALITIAIVVFAACSGGSSGSSGPSGPSPQPSVDPSALAIAAKDLRFSTGTLSAPAGEPFRIAFDNQESAPHNVAIYRDSSAREKVFGSDPFSGPAVVTYAVPALAAGTYFFRCDLHPDMSGRLVAG